MNIKFFICLHIIAVFSAVLFLNCSTADKKETGPAVDTDTISKTGNEIKPENIKDSKDEFAGNSITDVENPEQYIGEYTVFISNFKAKIKIYAINDKFYGEITFEKWGRGQPQQLKNLNISGNKIFFVRSIATVEEMNIYDSSRFFRQQFHGIISDDKKTIKGYYVDAGAEASWWAEKK